MKASPKVKTKPDETISALRARIDELERIVALQAHQHCHCAPVMPCLLAHYPCGRQHVAPQFPATWPQPFTISGGTGDWQTVPATQVICSSEPFKVGGYVAGITFTSH